MKQIFAHRALMNSQEHSFEGISYFAELGLAMELDLRNSSAGIYLSHDHTGKGILFNDICPILSKSDSLIALHIKELEVLPNIFELVNKFKLKNFFIFDSDFERMCSVFDNQYVGFYANMTPQNKHSAKILWCDEIKENWYSIQNIENLHKQNKILYSVSRELITSSSMDEIRSEWFRLIKLGFDGICTNYPLEIQKFWIEVEKK